MKIVKMLSETERIEMVEKALEYRKMEVAEALAKILRTIKTGTKYENVNSFFECSENEKYSMMVHCLKELWTVLPEPKKEDYIFVAFTLGLFNKKEKNELAEVIPAMFHIMHDIANQEYFRTKNNEALQNCEDYKFNIEIWKAVVSLYKTYYKNNI